MLWRRLYMVAVLNLFRLILILVTVFMSLLSWLPVHVTLFHFLFLLALFLIVFLIIVLINRFIAWNPIPFNVFPHLVQQFLFVFVLAADRDSTWEVKENWWSDWTERLIVEWNQRYFLLKKTDVFQEKISQFPLRLIKLRNVVDDKTWKLSLFFEDSSGVRHESKKAFNKFECGETFNSDILRFFCQVGKYFQNRLSNLNWGMKQASRKEVNLRNDELLTLFFLLLN